VPAESIAARYLAVHLEPVAVSRLTRFRHHAWALAYWLMPGVLGMLFSDPEPKEPTLLVVTASTARLGKPVPAHRRKRVVRRPVGPPSRLQRRCANNPR
jgi:hypothetical protein